ncbi:hypothetical protein [Peribacillus deserti]|uniref:Leucine-rich repeat domain-containing protein n=1 Tax=Peribacillus deserti TaxID=673318 RepID=A0A2N5M1J4_9BACI|nr:hypothetical protein [Peribacillus deserti]PLT28236.1 hypothetical protein CUU66_20055 [Peribacillus deserti]
MDYWRYNSMWFEEIPENQYAFLNFKNEKLSLQQINQAIEYLVLWHHKRNKIGNFSDFPKRLRYLQLNWSNIQDFTGIEKLSDLKRLDLHYCTKLSSDCGLAGLSDTLEILEIEQSKKFVIGEDLMSLKNLRVLRLYSCGSIENLSFLKNFPKLIEFSPYETNILDGNLQPLLDHPTIRVSGFNNKRHYNFSYEKMNFLLEEKNGCKEYKSIIEKGKYATFKFID